MLWLISLRDDFSSAKLCSRIRSMPTILRRNGCFLEGKSCPMLTTILDRNLSTKIQQLVQKNNPLSKPNFKDHQGSR